MRRKIFAAVGMVAIPLLALSLAQHTYQWLEPQQVSAQVGAPIVLPHPWTAVGSTGTVDELSLPFFAFTDTRAGYRAGNAAVTPLEFRYNVTNTFDNNANPNIPGWTTLELGATAPGNSTVDATLYRVYRCSGQRVILCQTRVAESPNGTCRTCTFAANAVDFTSFLYYVHVNVDRAVAAEAPTVNTLRIY